MYDCQDGVRIIPFRVETYLKRFAANLGIDPQILRKLYGKRLSMKLNVPLPLDDAHVMVPLKMRIPEGKNDTATGYVNHYCVRAVTEYKKKGVVVKDCSLVRLENDHEIMVLLSKAATLKRLNAGRLAGEYRYLLQRSTLQGFHLLSQKEGLSREELDLISQLVRQILLSWKQQKKKKKDEE